MVAAAAWRRLVALSAEGGFGEGPHQLDVGFADDYPTHKESAILYGAAASWVGLEELIYIELLGRPSAPTWLVNGFALAVAGICGVMGNRWYLAHIRKAVRDLHAGQNRATGSQAVAFSRDGALIATASQQVRLWKVATGEDRVSFVLKRGVPEMLVATEGGRKEDGGCGRHQTGHRIKIDFWVRRREIYCGGGDLLLKGSD